MPLAAKTPLFSPGGRVTPTALKWSGTSVTVGSLVAAITVRVIAEGAGVVCAAAAAASAIAPSSSISVILNRMIASLFNGYLEHRTRSQPRWERQAASRDTGCTPVQIVAPRRLSFQCPGDSAMRAGPLIGTTASIATGPRGNHS